MTNNKRTLCHSIIHSCAAVCAGGNAFPVPGLGFAVDTVAMTTMCMSLASAFGVDIPKSVAKGMAISALRRTMLKQPVKIIAKELSKIIPGLGQTVSPTISFSMIEAAGWMLVHEFEQQQVAA